MAGIGGTTTKRVAELLMSSNGLNSSIHQAALSARVQLSEIAPEHVFAQNVAFEVTERTGVAKYPSIHVYCERVANEMREKFRTFSGRIRMVVEIRVSQDRLEGLESQLHGYADAVTRVLDSNRGDWGSGMFYAGGYEINFGAVKKGGKNHIQSARVEFNVEGSLQ
jgi:hypothetical protein